jgi:hypothetical protein
MPLTSEPKIYIILSTARLEILTAMLTRRMQTVYPPSLNGLFVREDGGTTRLRNVGNYLPVDTE